MEERRSTPRTGRYAPDGQSRDTASNPRDSLPARAASSHHDLLEQAHWVAAFPDAIEVALVAARKVCPNEQDAEDAAQEVIMNVWEKGPGFWASLDVPLAYVAAATRNRASTLRSKGQRWFPLTASMARMLRDRSASPEDRLIERERRRIVASLIADLPPRCREVMHCRYLTGMSCAETARNLGISVSGVERQVTLGREKLMERRDDRLASLGLDDLLEGGDVGGGE